MFHRNARLTVRGRKMLVDRVLSGRPVAHVAREMGISRQAGHRWVRRFEAEGLPGLQDRSSRPHHSPAATAVHVRERILQLRQDDRLGPPELARLTGVSASTASRVVARAGLPRLHELDPVTGILIRASRRTQLRFERENPGDLVHVDVKKLGKIPDGGGWRLTGPDTINHNGDPGKRAPRAGFDYVHAAVDDNTRLAYAEVLPDEKGPTCAGFLTRAAEFYARHGITIKAVMSDNALNYRRSADFQGVIERLGASPWQNGKVERFNRTMQEGWAYRHPFTSNNDRTAALSTWLDHYNYTRPHTACGGQPPISRVSPTC